jgi:hypothetical protein
MDRTPHKIEAEASLVKAGLQPHRLRVQAVLPEILHNVGYPGRIRVIYDLDQMGLIGTVACRHHAVIMTKLIFDGLQRRRAKGLVYMNEKIGYLHGVLLAKNWTPCAGNEPPGQTQNV